MSLRTLIAAALRPDRVPNVDRPSSADRKRAALGVHPVSVNTVKDPRYCRERAGGYGSSAPYLPNRLGRPARRTGRPERVALTSR